MARISCSNILQFQSLDDRGNLPGILDRNAFSAHHDIVGVVHRGDILYREEENIVVGRESETSHFVAQTQFHLAYPSDVSSRVTRAERFRGVETRSLEVGGAPELDQVSLAPAPATLQAVCAHMSTRGRESRNLTAK